MSKNMVFLLILVTAFLLYDLLFNVTCFFPEQCHFFVHVVTAVLSIQSCYNGSNFRIPFQT